MYPLDNFPHLDRQFLFFPHSPAGGGNNEKGFLKHVPGSVNNSLRKHVWQNARPRGVPGHKNVCEKHEDVNDVPSPALRSRGHFFAPANSPGHQKKNICGDEMAFCEISVLRNQIMEHACVSYFGEKMSQAVEVVVEVAAAPSENEFCGTSWHARQVLRSRNLVGSGAGE